jgi:NADH-quinone oxidoreductase subunit N
MTFPTFTGEIVRELAPLLILLAGGMLFTIWGAVSRGTGGILRLFAALFFLDVLVFVVKLWNVEGWPMLGGMLIVDRFTLFFTAIIAICALGALLISSKYNERFGFDRSEFLALLFFSSAGMFVIVSSYNLVSLFLGLELMSIPVYVMTGFRRRDLLSNEAAIKYFVLGAFSIAFFLYGVSLIYGLCGTTNYKGIIVEILAKEISSSPALLLALALILAGFAFKVSSVPFHMWVPDVYQGAPTSVTAFMATAVKAAAFGGFLRFFYMSLMMERTHWGGIVWTLAVLTMTLGNIVALAQRNMKRMMAYSGIAHAGYILVGLASLSLVSVRGASSVLYYLLAYAFMNIGAFAVISVVEKREGFRGLEIDDYRGLGLKRPFLGLVMSVFMFSLAGIPPTAGFFAKYYVFSAAVERGLIGLAVIGVLNSLVSLYYYLRVIVYMYMQKGDEQIPGRGDLAVRVVLVVCVLAVFWLGLGPGMGRFPGVESILEWTRMAVGPVAGTGV